MTSPDTHPSADRRYHELLERMTPVQRFDAAAKLSDAVRELAVAGIRARHPEACEAEVRVRLAVRLYGREIAERLFASVPADAV